MIKARSVSNTHRERSVQGFGGNIYRVPGRSPYLASFGLVDSSATELRFLFHWISASTPNKTDYQGSVLVHLLFSTGSSFSYFFLVTASLSRPLRKARWIIDRNLPRILHTMWNNGASITRYTQLRNKSKASNGMTLSWCFLGRYDGTFF